MLQINKRHADKYLKLFYLIKALKLFYLIGLRGSRLILIYVFEYMDSIMYIFQKLTTD